MPATPPTLVQFHYNEIALSVVMPATKAGNTLVVFLANQNGSAVTFNPPTDGVNTWVLATAASITGTDDSINSQISTYYATNIVGGSVTISATIASGTPTNDSIYAFELSGAAIYERGCSALGHTTNAVCGPVNLSQINQNAITVVLCAHGVNTSSAGPGMIFLGNTTGYSWGLEWGIFPTGSVRPQMNNADDTFHSWAIAAPFFYTPQTPTDAVFFGMT
jgi:hypothetical protein